MVVKWAVNITCQRNHIGAMSACLPTVFIVDYICTLFAQLKGGDEGERSKCPVLLAGLLDPSILIALRRRPSLAQQGELLLRVVWFRQCYVLAVCWRIWCSLCKLTFMAYSRV